MELTLAQGFDDVVASPVKDRSTKPRPRGITMVIDKGLGLTAFADLLAAAADYIDLWKLGFGTALLYERSALREKVALARRCDVLVYPGGTLLELAVAQGRGLECIERIAALGFTAVEVSEGTIPLEPALRRRLIAKGRECGLVVLSEVGKKDPARPLDPAAAVKTILADLECGAQWVLVEGRDSGRGVGVYDADGAIRGAQVDAILAGVGGAADRLIWEAPAVAQQNAWLKRLGPNANFGNVQPGDVISLEATRQALRGDTLQAYVNSL